MSGLTALFVPASIAVLGVSRNPAKLGYRLLQNVKEGGFGGAIHPVNPSGESILGLPTVPSIDALPDAVALALVSLPAPAVPDAIKALAARRVRAAVILSSGFGEVDDDGRATQRDLLATARAAGLRLVGPNCMGVYSAPASLNGTYFWDLPSAAGGISIVSQSGAYGGLIFPPLRGGGPPRGRVLWGRNPGHGRIAAGVAGRLRRPRPTPLPPLVRGRGGGAACFPARPRAGGARTPGRCA